MQGTDETAQHDWVTPVLGIALALAIAIGAGFLVGQQTPSATDNMSEICGHLPREASTADCIALRSAVAGEQATSISQWALWVSFGTLVASVGALGGLIIAFIHGRRTIMLAIEANRISMNNSQSQARAYVVVQSVECQLDNQGQLFTRVKFQNSGLTPARNLRWLHDATLNIINNEYEQTTLRLGTEPDLENSHWRQDIPSAETWASTPTGLPKPKNPEIVTCIREAVFIAITAKIVADYQDVFGITHQETACFQGRVYAASSDAPYIKLERANDDVFNKQAERITI